MSASRIIPRLRAGSATAWRPEELSEREPVVAPPAADPVGPTAAAEPEGSNEGAAALQEEAARVREAARAEGYRAGLEQGRLAAADDVVALRSLIGRLAELTDDLEQGIASDVLSLALDLARHMVRSALRVRPELVLAVIRDAVKSFPELADGPRLVLHPADAELVRAAADPMGADGIAWTIVEDPQLARGGCRFQSGATEVDATLENRWRRVVAALGRDDTWIDIDPREPLP